MATIRAIIRKTRGRYITNAAGQCVVYAQYGHNAKTFLVNTDVHVTPPEWSLGKQVVIFNKSDIRDPELRKSFEKKIRLQNALISKIKNELISISSALILKDKTPAIELVKEIYHNRDGLENQERSTDLSTRPHHCCRSSYRDQGAPACRPANRL